jgi:hypothetical protein
MVRTRAQGADQSANDTTSTSQHNAKVGKGLVSENPKNKGKTRGTKREQGHEKVETTPTEPAAKKAKGNKAKQKPAEPANPKVASLLSKYGALPLEQSLPDTTSPNPKTILALLLNAILSSARISHALAAKSVACLIEADYHDIQVLKKASWEEKTAVLTKGGYTRYREKTATMLDGLADLVLEKYDGDLNNLVKQNNSEPGKIRAALKEIKGLGDVGVDIFFDTAQGVWPCLAPFVDPRSLKTAQQLGLGTVEELWHDTGEDPMEMCRLSTALTTVRLEKKEKEFM